MDPILDGTTNQRFQLFPIEYDEVSICDCAVTLLTILTYVMYSYGHYTRKL